MYEEAKRLTPKRNLQIARKLIKDWHLGPKKAYDNNVKNDVFWKSISKKWYVSEVEARRRSCASCEYGSISPVALQAMAHIPYNALDKDGGMRVWCDKFDFICHATRVCQAWDNKEETEE